MMPDQTRKNRQNTIICVAIHDDYIREKIAGILSRLPQVGLVAQCRDLCSCEQVLQETQFHVMIVGMNNSAAQRPDMAHIRKRRPKTHIIAIGEPEECAAATPEQFGAYALIPITQVLPAIQELLNNRLHPGPVA